MLQPELFGDLPPNQKPKHFQFANFPGRFLRLRVAYEDAVFTLLGLVLVVLAGFCLGVERGKQLGPQLQIMSDAGVATARESVSVPEVVRVQAQAPAPVQQRKPIPVIPAAVAVAPQPAADASPVPTGGGFAIQLATYAGPEMAQQEVRRLAKQGVRAQVLKQGKYLELRAVGYRSKQEAKSALAGLRKMYPDAFLKQVSNH